MDDVVFHLLIGCLEFLPTRVCLMEV